MFLLFAYDRYDATGGIEDLVAIAETLVELEKFIDNNEKCIKSFCSNSENIYAYNPTTESRYDYVDNRFNTIGYKLLRSQKVQTYNEKFN